MTGVARISGVNGGTAEDGGVPTAGFDVASGGNLASTVDNTTGGGAPTPETVRQFVATVGRGATAGPSRRGFECPAMNAVVGENARAVILAGRFMNRSRCHRG